VSIQLIFSFFNPPQREFDRLRERRRPESGSSISIRDVDRDRLRGVRDRFRGVRDRDLRFGDCDSDLRDFDFRLGDRDRDLRLGDRDRERDFRFGDWDSDLRERRRDRERERLRSRLSPASLFLTVMSRPLSSYPSNFRMASLTSEADSKQTSPLFLPSRSCASV